MRGLWLRARSSHNMEAGTAGPGSTGRAAHRRKGDRMRTARRLPLFTAALAAALLPAAPPRALGQEGPKPAGPSTPQVKKPSIDTVLKGNVVSFDGTVIEVHYDFSDPAQLEDFPDFRPFHIEGPWKKEWFDKTLHVTGTGGVVWKVILRKRVEVDFEVRLKVPRDFGAYIAEDRVSDERAVFSIYDQFFQNKDHRGQAKTHMICRATVHAPDAHGDYAFRYVVRSPNPPVGTQKPVKVRLGREGSDEWFEIEGSKMNGSENQWPALKGFRPGFYLIDSESFISDVVIRGEVDPVWAEKAGVDLAVPIKPKGPGKAPEREATAADLAARQRIEAVRTGAEVAGALVPVLSNGALLDSVREEAAKVLEDAGDVKVVTRLVSAMESDDPTARRLAGRVVSKLTGKTFGFSADAPEAERRKSIRSLLDFIEKNPAKFR
jgi:hypothetical protein